MSSSKGSDLPIDSSDASASMSFSDVNITDNHVKTESLRHLEEAVGAGDNSAASLPTDEEIRARVNPQPKDRHRVLLWLAGSVMIVALVVGLSVGLVKRSSESTTRNAPSFEELVVFLTIRNVSTYHSLTTSGTPQYRAAKWLAEDDGANLPLPNHTTNDSQAERDSYLYVFRYVMAVNYFAMNGPNWKYRMNFLTDKNVCSWNGLSKTVDGVYVGLELGGVKCRPGTKLPYALDLELNDLAGQIPTENGLLTSLTYFDLDYNAGIDGTIPTELCNLLDLKVFLLRSSMVEGGLPSCILNWRDLAVLDVQDSEFNGQFPSDVCALTDLQLLGLDHNDFQGEVPDCIGGLTNLRFLFLSDNQFTGEIPDLSPLANNLVDLYLDDNFFVGDPLPKINELKNLMFLYLDDNNFEGDITDLANDMTQLHVLDLSFNQFTSTVEGVPKHLFDLPFLQVLDVSNNRLQGTIPGDIARNDILFYLSVQQNQLGGSITPSLKNLTALQHLDLSNNTFSGALPYDIFQIPSLVAISLSENSNLQPGTIPASLDSAQQLTVISLANTNRNGTLPELLNFQNLALLDLDNNGLTGMIPSNYGQLPSLQALLLNNNPLEGPLPEFESTRGLYILAVDGTDVSGDFSSVCSLPAFAGNEESAIVVADCADEDSGIECACCYCCSKDDADGMCKDHTWAGLDWMWEANPSTSSFREEAFDLLDITL